MQAHVAMAFTLHWYDLNIRVPLLDDLNLTFTKLAPS